MTLTSKFFNYVDPALFRLAKIFINPGERFFSYPYIIFLARSYSLIAIFGIFVNFVTLLVGKEFFFIEDTLFGAALSTLILPTSFAFSTCCADIFGSYYNSRELFEGNFFGYAYLINLSISVIIFIALSTWVLFCKRRILVDFAKVNYDYRTFHKKEYSRYFDRFMALVLNPVLFIASVLGGYILAILIAPTIFLNLSGSKELALAIFAPLFTVYAATRLMELIFHFYSYLSPILPDNSDQI